MPSIRARNGYPGVIALLVAERRLAADLPGLDVLAERFRGRAGTIVTHDRRLEEDGWPLAHDAVLAAQTAAQFVTVPEPMRAHLTALARWPRDAALDLRRGADEAGAIAWGAQFAGDPTDAADQIFRTLHPGRDDDLLARFHAAQRAPVADVDAAEIASLVALAAHSAADGWLMYHVHRGYDSHVAELVAPVIDRIAARAGAAVYPFVVERALALG